MFPVLERAAAGSASGYWHGRESAGGIVSEGNPPDADRFGPGARIASYLLEEQIGSGGMAVVYRAHDVRLDRRVALKILAPELARDQGFRQRFIRESRAAAAVDHPNIIPIFEAGEASGVLFIAMRYVQGRDLRTLLDREGTLPAVHVAYIIAQMASALDAAHARGLVHRDVKPANMLLDEAAGSDQRDHIYLSDFGLSKQSLAAADLTSAGQFLGTLDYVAPEQIEGLPVDGRADLYALACAAFEMLCGAPPFNRDQRMAVLWAQLSEPPPRVTDRRPDLPAAVDQVMAKALAKTPADRYATCVDFAVALRTACRLRADEAASGRRTSPVETSATPPRPRPATEVATPARPVGADGGSGTGDDGTSDDGAGGPGAGNETARPGAAVPDVAIPPAAAPDAAPAVAAGSDAAAPDSAIPDSAIPRGAAQGGAPAPGGAAGAGAGSAGHSQTDAAVGGGGSAGIVPDEPPSSGRPATEAAGLPKTRSPGAGGDRSAGREAAGWEVGAGWGDEHQGAARGGQETGTGEDPGAGRDAGRGRDAGGWDTGGDRYAGRGRDPRRSRDAGEGAETDAGVGGALPIGASFHPGSPGPPPRYPAPRENPRADRPWMRSRAALVVACAAVVGLAGAAFAIHTVGKGGTRATTALTAPGCSTATAAAQPLANVHRAMVPLAGKPYAVALTPDGKWTFVTLGLSVAVMKNGGALAPSLVRTISVPTPANGEAHHQRRTLPGRRDRKRGLRPQRGRARNMGALVPCSGSCSALAATQGTPSRWRCHPMTGSRSSPS